MKVCIHRGSRQIGGSCVELRSQGHRLLLDIGMPLDHLLAGDLALPESLNAEASEPIAGVTISHPHADHYGLADQLPPKTPFLMGPAAERILQAAAVFTPSGAAFQNVTHFKDREMVAVGSFRVTPYLMDHSAYDSYALHVESAGKGVFYTGDLRAHGRKAALFEKLLRLPPSPVDVLLMEGTTLAREGTAAGFPSEADLESRFADLFKSTPGIPLVWCSGQNIDRLVTVFRAAKRAGRQLILDMYTTHILAATENPRVPQASWDGVRVFLPHYQKLRIKRDQAFDAAARYRPYRIFPEDFASLITDSVMLFRPSMRVDLEKAACLNGACLVYSMWDGYLQDDGMQPFLDWLTAQGIPLHKCHTSGHASVKDLQRLREAFPGAVVVPIHTPAPDRYEAEFGRVEVHSDGEWWDL